MCSTEKTAWGNTMFSLLLVQPGNTSCCSCLSGLSASPHSALSRPQTGSLKGIWCPLLASIGTRPTGIHTDKNTYTFKSSKQCSHTWNPNNIQRVETRLHNHGLMHAMVRMWMSEDKLRHWSSSFTLFETVSLLSAIADARLPGLPWNSWSFSSNPEH